MPGTRLVTLCWYRDALNVAATDEMVGCHVGPVRTRGRFVSRRVTTRSRHVVAQRVTRGHITTVRFTAALKIQDWKMTELIGLEFEGLENV